MPCKPEQGASEKGQDMRAMMWTVGIMACLWMGYWFVGSTAVERGATAAFAQAADQGLIATNQGVHVAGFPNRFDLTITAPDIGDAKTGVRWQSPDLKVYAMTWKPWHIITVLANTQTITLPGQTLGIVTTDARASVKAKPKVALPLDQIDVSVVAPVVTSTLGWTLGADGVELHTRADASVPNGHEVSLVIPNLRPDPMLVMGTGLPDAIQTIGVDMVASFSAPLDRNAEATQPRLTGLRVKEGTLLWGELSVAAQGKIAANADGLAEGRIDITVKGWRKIIPLAVISGFIKPDVAPTVEAVLNGLATQSGDANVLQLPLVYKAGRGTLGPIPLGAAPRLN
jgi:hypothetical protein